MIEEILTEVRKIPNLIDGQKIKSFLLFNINENDKKEIFNSINLEFFEINKKLEELRKNEVSELYDLRKPIFEKYEELEKRYKDSERLDYVKELHAEFRQDNMKLILESRTHSSELKKDYQFIELDLDEYDKKEKRYKYLNKNMDFTNLINVNRKNPNFLYYKLTVEEQEYEELKTYFNNCRSNKSLVTYCEKYEPKLDELLNSVYSGQYLNWFFLAFKTSKEEFDKFYSGRTKYWLYDNNTKVIE